MGFFLMLSLLGFGSLPVLFGEDTSDEDGSQNSETDGDLDAPDAPILGENAYDIMDSADGAIDIDDGNSTDDSEYQLTVDHYYYDIETGSGDDTVVVDGDIFGLVRLGDGDDAAWGGDGNDTLRGEAGNDNLYGGAGNDTLVDLEGENYLHGGDGDDTLITASGSTAVGGDGADTFELSLSTDAETPLSILDFNPDEDQISSISLTVIDGDAFDLTAVAREDGDGTNLMFDDRVLAEIFGASEDDLADLPISVTVQGGEYTDDDTGRTIRGDGSAPVTIFAEGGDDTITVTGGVVDGGDGNDVIFANGQFTQDTDVYNEMSTVSGGAGDDIILSSNGNILTGGEGDDIFGLSLTQYNGSGTGSGFDLTETVITDFNPDEDTLYIEGAFITQAGGTTDDVDATMSIVVWENGEGADVLAGDEVIASVTGGQTLTVGDLEIAEGGLETELLGYH